MTNPKLSRLEDAFKTVAQNDLLTAVLKWFYFLKIEQNKSHHTVLNYAHDVKTFLFFLKDHLEGLPNLHVLTELKLSDFRSFLAHRSQKNVTSQSNKRALSALKNFFAFLDRRFLIKNVEIKHLTSPRTQKSLPRPLQTVQALSLPDALTACFPKDPKWVILRDQTLILCMYGAGLRISEALSLRLKDIDENDSFRVLGKGAKERIIPILPAVNKQLKIYLHVRKSLFFHCASLFVGAQGRPLNPGVFQARIRKLRQFLNLPDSFTPHSLRHTFATDLLRNHANLRVIQDLLGHTSLASTESYTDIEADELLQTIEYFHPQNSKS